MRIGARDPAEVGATATPVGNTPAEAAKRIAEERERWHKIIVSAGIKPQ